MLQQWEYFKTNPPYYANTHIHDATDSCEEPGIESLPAGKTVTVANTI